MPPELRACPRVEHAGARVTRHGSYGPYRRQRFRCRPPDGSAHTFSTFPGPPGEPDRLRCFRHDAADIARALVHIGRGATYRQAAIQVGRGRAMDRINGQLVANWVATFAPIVTAGSEPSRWPPVIGIGAFALRRTGSRGDLLVQLAATPGATLVQARVSRPDRDIWEEFFDRLDGQPEMIIAGAGSRPAEAVRRSWPQRPPLVVEGTGPQATPGLSPAHIGIEGTIAGLWRCWDALFRRLASRQGHFTNLDQLGHLLELMRLDLNGTADQPTYLRRILAGGAR